MIHCGSSYPCHRWLINNLPRCDACLGSWRLKNHVWQTIADVSLNEGKCTLFPQGQIVSSCCHLLDKTMRVCAEGWFRGQDAPCDLVSLLAVSAVLVRYRNFLRVCYNDVAQASICSAAPPLPPPHPPNAIVIAWAQVLSFIFFITHLFPVSPGLFSFIRLSPRRQCKASHCCRVASRYKFILWWAGEKSLYNRDQGD